MSPEYLRRSWRLFRAHQRGELAPLVYAVLCAHLRRHGGRWRWN